MCMACVRVFDPTKRVRRSSARWVTFQPTPGGWIQWYEICAGCLHDKWRSMNKSYEEDSIVGRTCWKYDDWHKKLFEPMILHLAAQGMTEATAEMFKLRNKIDTNEKGNSSTEEDCMT